jgi:LysR family transcriptional regulator, glycine cleavage system transcriptional activator
MTRRLPSLSGFRVFDAVARHMSFTRAGDELCVTQGAVSRSIRGLEDELGLPLFVRLPRRLELTEEGRSLWLSTREALDTLERAVLRISSRDDARILTINVLPTFATKWLIPRLMEFNDLHPQVEVHLITSIRPVDFSSEDTDVAIRVGQIDVATSEVLAPRIDLVMTETYEGIRAERLLADELIPVAAPDLLKRKGPIRKVADFAKITLLHNATRKNAWPDWLKAVGNTQIDGTKGLFFGHFILALQAAINCQGVALIPRILIEDDIAARRLVVAFDRPVSSAGSYFLLCRQHHWDVPKVKVFREWLKRKCELGDH